MVERWKKFGLSQYCISIMFLPSVLLLLKQIVTYFVIENYKNLLYYSSLGRKFNTVVTGLKPRCWQSCIPFHITSGRESVSLHFPTSRGWTHSLARVVFLHFQQHCISSSILPCALPSDSPLLPPSSTDKNPYDYSRSTRIIQGSLSILWLKD